MYIPNGNNSQHKSLEGYQKLWTELLLFVTSMFLRKSFIKSFYRDGFEAKWKSTKHESQIETLSASIQVLKVYPLVWWALGVWVHKCPFFCKQKEEAFNLKNPILTLKWDDKTSMPRDCFPALSRNLITAHKITKQEDYVDIWRKNMNKYPANIPFGYDWMFKKRNTPKHL